MGSRSLVFAAIAVGIAIGYIGGFLTFYNVLSDVESVNTTAIRDELDSLKKDLTEANTRVVLLTEDNEKLRFSLIEIRSDNEVLQKRVDALQVLIEDPNGSVIKIERSLTLIHMISGPMPFEGQELSEWRVTVVNETAKLDPTLVPVLLRLVDSWVQIVQFEEKEPEENTPAWNQWNVEWQQKALLFMDIHSTAISRLTDVAIREIDSIKSLT